MNKISKHNRNKEYEAVHLNRLGRVYALIGNNEEAKLKFKEALSLLPEEHPDALDSKERLKQLELSK